MKSICCTTFCLTLVLQSCFVTTTCCWRTSFITRSKVSTECEYWVVLVAVTCHYFLQGSPHTALWPHMLIGNVWIYRYRLLFFFCLCVFVCTVTDISTQDDAGDVEFCSADQHLRQGISHVGELCSPRIKIKNAQNRMKRQASGPPHLHVNITVDMRRRKCYTTDAPYVWM